MYVAKGNGNQYDLYKQVQNIGDKMSDDLANRGIYFDDIYVLRVLDPEITTETHDLRSESSEYIQRK